MIHRLRVHGWVQGVGYRAWTVREARALGLRGWVRNRGDGSVEILAQGPEAALAELAARCRQGPPEARVDRVEIEPDAEAGDILAPDFTQRNSSH